MLKKLTLEHFKNFKHTELSLGPVTTVIGTNASGKSNLRDAFRFLHGIGRGYTLAEIMGEKYGEGGELQWKGIRGGIREAAYLQKDFNHDVGKAQSIALITLLECYSMRFFEFNPQVMRFPSLPGQTVLGDRGENLSSVLQAMCEDAQKKHALVEWIRELTPMDAIDFEFIPDRTGRILLTLVEDNGRRTSAYSASDGTLRFLAIIAALLGPKPAKLLFFEELENGLHPSRLHLLLQLMERKAAEGKMQIINTTHSPQFLRFLSPQALEHVSLTYRLPGNPNGRIQRLFDIPEARRLVEEQDIASLHDSGWFENTLYLDETEEKA